MAPHIQELAIALGNDPGKNYRQRELPWYALWNTVLRRFEKLDSCCLSPQYPLWSLDSEESEIGSSIPRSPSDIEMDPDPEDALISFKHVLGRSRIYSDSDSMSLSPPSSPLAHKSAPKPPLLPTPSPPQHPPTQPLPPLSKTETHKVTDFAILHLRNAYNAATSEREILDVIIPIITEVKTYRRSNNNDDDISSKLSLRSGMREAQKASKAQVGYLFSGARQSSVIAIAAAGSFWTWRQFFKADVEHVYGSFDDTDYMPSDDILDPTRQSQWSGYLQIGKMESNTMLDRIEAWAEAFIDPFNTDISVLRV